MIYKKLHTECISTKWCRSGYSLAELLVSLVIASMILVVVFSLFARVHDSAEDILKNIKSERMPSEVLQLIAEDIDGLVDSSTNVKITVENKFDNGLPIARLVLTKTYTDKDLAEQILEQITWQANVDVPTGRIVLYRSYEGILPEDKLLDKERRDVEKLYPFIPVCGGLSAFKIRVPQGENWLDIWQSPDLPTGIEVMISQADPVSTPGGEYEILQKNQIIRTIAINRTRKIPFKIEQERDQKQQTTNNTL